MVNLYRKGIPLLHLHPSFGDKHILKENQSEIKWGESLKRFVRNLFDNLLLYERSCQMYAKIFPRLFLFVCFPTRKRESNLLEMLLPNSSHTTLETDAFVDFPIFYMFSIPFSFRKKDFPTLETSETSMQMFTVL